MFDLVVTKKEPKTGKVISQDPYIMHVDKDGTFFERPPHSGKFYDITNQLVKDTSPEGLKATEAKAQEALKAQEAKEKAAAKTKA